MKTSLIAAFAGLAFIFLAGIALCFGGQESFYFWALIATIYVVGSMITREIERK